MLTSVMYLPLVIGSSLFASMLNKKSTKCTKNKQDILSQRTFSGLTQETKSLIELVTLEKGIFPVGSFKYKAHRYPSDIDIFEPIKACCDKESASKEITERIQKMIINITKKDGIYVGDFKAGLDSRYDIPITNVYEKIKELYDNKLITKDDLEEIQKLEYYDDLVEYMRKYYIIRWNTEELIKGIKILPLGKLLTLEEAITHKSIVKIDVWAPQDGNYNEITNFLLIIMKNEKGEEIVLNEELGDRLISLNHDIVKYSSKEQRNSLKVAKRLWSRALFLGDKKLPKILYPLFQSGCNSLNQVAGELEIVSKIIQKIPNPPIKMLLKQIDGFRRRIIDVFDVDFDPNPALNIINNILENNLNILKGLEELEKELKTIIERHANNYLECNLPELDDIIEDAKKNQKSITKKRLAIEIHKDLGDIF